MLVRFLAITALLLSASSVQAGALTFDASVALNFSNLGAGSDQNPVTAIDFGSSSLPGSARFAYNGTDGAGQNNAAQGKGQLSIGDSARVVGHGLINTFDGQGVANNSFFAQLRNVDGTVVDLGLANGGSASGVLGTIFNAGSLAGGTGLLDLYVKVAPGFDITNAATSSNGILAATFAVVSGGITPSTLTGLVTNNATVSNTAFTATLVYNNSGFLSDTFGNAFTAGNLSVFTQVSTTDRVILAANQSLKNIHGTTVVAVNKDFAGNGSLLNIGSAFNPQTGTYNNTTLKPLDLVLSVDGNGAFATVPEPASLAVFGLLSVGALVAGRRTRKN